MIGAKSLGTVTSTTDLLNYFMPKIGQALITKVNCYIVVDYQPVTVRDLYIHDHVKLLHRCYSG